MADRLAWTSAAASSGILLVPNDRNPRNLVVVLHGYGGDATQASASTALLREALDETAWYFPDGPAPAAMIPSGREWFGLTSLPGPLYTRVASATADVARRLCELQNQLQIGNQRTALLGFSQGAMIALHFGLRHPRPLGAIVSLSGLLVGPERLPAEIRARPPVLMIHGRMDRMVSMEDLEASERALRAAGVPVRIEIQAHAHEIASAAMGTCSEFLGQALLQ